MAETLPGWGSHCFIQGKDHSSPSVWHRTGKGLQRFMPSLPDSTNGLKTLVLHLQDSLYREGPKCQHLNLWGSDGCWAVWVASVVTIMAAAITTGSIWMLKCCLTLKKKHQKQNKKMKTPTICLQCILSLWSAAYTVCDTSTRSYFYAGFATGE